MSESAVIRDSTDEVATSELSGIEKWLRDLDTDPDKEPPSYDPGLCITEIYNLWVERGGLTSRKKNRHSISLLRELLGENIPSLYPKLVGNMSMSAVEYTEFLRAFFSHWTYDGDKPRPIFGKEPRESSAFAIRVAKKLLQDGGTVLAKRKPTNELAIRQFFQDYTQTDGCIIISSATGTIPRQPGEDSVGPFLDVIARAVRNAHQDFLLIFVIDRGVPPSNKGFATPAHFLRFLNRELLRAHLKAVRLFGLPKQVEKGLRAFAQGILPSEAPKPDEVWEEFSNRCCVLERQEVKEDEEVWDRLSVSAKHLLPPEDAAPEGWLNDPNTRQLYDRDTLNTKEGLSLVATARERRSSIVEAKFWVFPGKSDDTTLMHPGNAMDATAVPIQSPDDKGYVAAAELIYRAARHIMGKNPTDKELDEAALNAIERMGFKICKASEFANIRSGNPVEGSCGD